jgi:hypothetical protein
MVEGLIRASNLYKLSLILRDRREGLRDEIQFSFCLWFRIYDLGFTV